MGVFGCEDAPARTRRPAVVSFSIAARTFASMTDTAAIAPKKLFLLDAFALIYRSHFAFSKNPRINSKGMNTGAVLGFTNTLVEVLQKEKPTHIGVCFDGHKKTEGGNAGAGR